MDLGIGDLDLNMFGPASTITPPTSPLSSFDSTVSSIGASIANVFNTQAGIVQAQNNAALAKAQGQAAVTAAKAGTPSLNILVLGGFVLGALVLLKKN